MLPFTESIHAPRLRREFRRRARHATWRVGHGTVIGNRVHIGSHSRIGSGAVIEHGTSVNADSTVPDGGHVAAEPRRRSRAAPAKRAQPRQRKSQNRQAA